MSTKDRALLAAGITAVGAVVAAAITIAPDLMRGATPGPSVPEIEEVGAQVPQQAAPSQTAGPPEKAASVAATSSGAPDGSQPVAQAPALLSARDCDKLASARANADIAVYDKANMGSGVILTMGRGTLFRIATPPGAGNWVFVCRNDKTGYILKTADFDPL